MDCTPALQRAIEAAAVWARRLGNNFIDSRAILLALLEEEEGHAAQIFQMGGIVPDSVRQLILDTAMPAEVDSLTRLLAEARGLAQELSGERRPGTQHATLAAIRLSPIIQGRLDSAGFCWDRVWNHWKSGSPTPITIEEPLQLEADKEEIDAARIVDVNANRASEALRVIDDYCRFVLADSFLTAEVKSLRHELAEVMNHLRPDCSVRDTLHDIGTTISTNQELQRHSTADVARINLKRLQEALRSLEEYGKLLHPSASQRIEQLRYRSYTLEKTVLRGLDCRSRLAAARLYLLVTASACSAEMEYVVREAIAGGVDIVQLREKNVPDRDLLRKAQRLRQITHDTGALFIVNDRADVARLVQADGVHLGQDDLPLVEARRIVGPKALIGVSTHNLRQLHSAIREGADYLGIGPVFTSRTKEFEDLAGLDYIRQATAESSLPMFAIGGIILENLPRVIEAGANRIAVSSAICSADEPRLVAAAMRRLLTEVSPL
jgi:thiamine-phosphate pyrophosphorylase